MTDNYELEFFAEDDGTEPVLAWIKNDLTAARRQAPSPEASIPLSESCFASSATPTVTS